MDIIRQSLRLAGTKLAQRDWGAALYYLGGQAPFESRNGRVLLKSIAAAIAADHPDYLTTSLLTISPSRLVKIALLDDGMLLRTFSAADPATDVLLIQNITEGFRSLRPQERCRTSFGYCLVFVVIRTVPFWLRLFRLMKYPN